MMAPQSQHAHTAPKVQWMHRLFMKGTYVLSCDIDVRADGAFVATLFPLWAPEEQVTEMFTGRADAMRWYAEMLQRLQFAGWLLIGGRAVTTAA